MLPITVLLLMMTALCAAQTVPSNKQTTKRLTEDEGVILQTEKDGLKAAFPWPGFAYMVGGKTAQLLPTTCPQMILSEQPIRQPNGTYLLKFRPNPAIIAVFRNGLRLAPSKYNLIWTDKNQLPDRFEVPGSESGDEVIVDYAVGVSTEMPVATVK